MHSHMHIHTHEHRAGWAKIKLPHSKRACGACCPHHALQGLGSRPCHLWRRRWCMRDHCARLLSGGRPSLSSRCRRAGGCGGPLAAFCGCRCHQILGGGTGGEQGLWVAQVCSHPPVHLSLQGQQGEAGEKVPAPLALCLRPFSKSSWGTCCSLHKS